MEPLVASATQVDDLSAFARFTFDSGNYGQAWTMLQAVVRLQQAEESERLLGPAWGKLACEILLGEWAAAGESVARLRDLIERTKDAALQLVQRAWLAHWALFVFVRAGAGEAGLARFLELATSEPFLNALQAAAPRALRYVLAAATVVGRERELVRVAEVEREALRGDPVAGFVLALYVEYDFDAALAHLAKARALLAADYFAAGLAESFFAAARQLVFRSFCRVHSAMDLGLLAAKLGMSGPDTETYIVNLIRNDQDAKIDSASNQIVFAPAASPYQQRLLEKTQALHTQTALLQAQLLRTK